MTVSISPSPKQQFNQSGIPLAGGKLFTYGAGGTTKQTTYTDSTGGTANTNPIILDGNGQCDIWLADNLKYKYVLSPSTDTDPPTSPFWTEDNVASTNNASVALSALFAGTSGAGLSGFAQSYVYGAGTVGAKLKRLVSVVDAPFNAETQAQQTVLRHTLRQFWQQMAAL